MPSGSGTRRPCWGEDSLSPRYFLAALPLPLRQSAQRPIHAHVVICPLPKGRRHDLSTLPRYRARAPERHRHARAGSASAGLNRWVHRHWLAAVAIIKREASKDAEAMGR
jgi:hypothetical protein